MKLFFGLILIIAVTSCFSHVATPEEKAFLSAAEKGDKDTVQRYISEKKIDINTSSYRKTALILASDKGKIEVVQLLISAGADLNQKDGNGFTALFYATARNHFDLVKLLVESGADVNARSSTSDMPTSLFLASDPEIIKYLISKGADVNARSKNGTTVLINAVLNAVVGGSLEKCKILIAAGADVNAKNDKGMTPLKQSEGIRDIVNLLKQAGAKE